MLNKFLKGFMWFWIGLNFVYHTLGFIAAFATLEFWTALDVIQERYSPFNLASFLRHMLYISPAFGAYLWLSKRGHAPF